MLNSRKPCWPSLESFQVVNQELEQPKYILLVLVGVKVFRDRLESGSFIVPSKVL